MPSSRIALRFFSILSLLLLGACSESNQDFPDQPVASTDTAIQIEPDWIQAHMAVLADDLLEGREAGTRGEALAALYIRTRFQALGLEPAGENGSFIQDFHVRATRLLPGSVTFRITGAEGQSASFENGGDIAVFGNPVHAESEVSAPVVFAGGGIVAPGLGLNDYAGLDVEGKIVAVLGGPPPFMGAEEAAHYGSTDFKAHEAAKRGAAGLIILWTPALEARFAFTRMKSILGRTDLNWIGPDGQPNVAGPGLKMRAFVNGTATEALFAGADRSYNELLQDWQAGSPAGFALESRITFSQRSRHDDGLTAKNVGGLLPGSDPDRASEVVIVSAHYDHVGIGTPVNGDAIYNGAGDNAFGTAALIEIARHLSTQERKPARSILFLAVGAEEKGLIGSDYFAENPTVPRDNIIANINIDGGLLTYDFQDVIAFGGRHSELNERLADALLPLGMQVAEDPFPEQGIFTRSDQYSFARRGIPSVFLFTGFTDMEGKKTGRGVWDYMTGTHLHKPTDDMSLPFDFTVAAKLTDIARRMVLETASAGQAPKWYSDSTIGRLFAPDAEKARRPD